MKTLVAIIAALPSTAHLFIQSLLGVFVIHAQGIVEPAWTDGARKRESEQAALWVGVLARAASLEPNDKFDALWLGLRNMGHRMRYPGHSLAIHQIYGEIQRNFLATPGHAEYFAAQIEKERAALKPEEYRGSFDNHRFWYLRETLQHLPSPETVKVLGHYLADDRDIPPPERWDDGGRTPANSIIAMESLLCLGLRDAPYPPGRYLERTRFLPAVRAWFAPIQSGETAFSFKGQAVEYRFNPDGTWVSTPIDNPPDDAPKPPPSTAPPRDHSKPPPPAPLPPPAATGNHLPPWPWLAGGTLAMLAAAWFFLKSRKPPVV
jgi:hypothetical protein